MRDPLSPKHEEEMDDITRLVVNQRRLRRPFGLPRPNRRADDPVYRLGKRGTRLVHRYVQVTDGVLSLVRPSERESDAADAESTDLIHAQTAEQPDDGERLHKPERIEMRSVESGTEIRLSQVQASPEQFRPDVVGNDPRARTDQRTKASGGREAPSRIEPPRDPAPFLDVPEESGQRSKMVGLRFRGKRPAWRIPALVATGGPFAGVHPADRADPLRRQLASPPFRRRALRMELSYPAAGLQE